jgi:hypothetical protein
MNTIPRLTKTTTKTAATAVVAATLTKTDFISASVAMSS